MKKEIRVLGIDDSPFEKSSKGDIIIVGVVMRGGSWIDGILSSKVKIDGGNATKKIIEMVAGSKFRQQLRCIFLDGIAVAGFNVVDINELSEQTGIPVVVVIRKMPDIEKIKRTLIELNKRSKIKQIEKAGEISRIGNIFVQLSGIDEKSAAEILKIACTRSHIPEPLRLAHLIASGIIKGESRGKA